jgi:DNA-directed RNA polymerase specialized sigma24 family protein
MESLRGAPARREFECFAAEASAGLLRTGYVVTSDLAEAEDLVQETLLRTAKRWPRMKRMDYPLAYARRILVNLALWGAHERARHGHDEGDDGSFHANHVPRRLVFCPGRWGDNVSNFQQFNWGNRAY